MQKKLPLQVRVTEAEKQTISALARENGQSISEFVRGIALQKRVAEQNDDLRKKIVPLACRLYDLIACVEKPDLQTKFKKWGCEFWHAIK